jgi:hypothetical protein
MPPSNPNGKVSPILYFLTYNSVAVLYKRV